MGMESEDVRSRRSRVSFPTEEVERYCRQMILPQFGVDGQRRLRGSSVLVVGAGGLGCPAALYLASAGVGRLGIVDRGDVVDKSNLHRQIAHVDRNVGKDKAVSLMEAVLALNPTLNVEAFSVGVSPSTVMDLIRSFDVILDCTDNVVSRYVINDACAILHKPLVSGSAIGFEGQLSVYNYGTDTPCYRCIFKSAPPAQCVGSCDTAGVLGSVPGMIGTLQATEALKITAGIKGSQVLSRRMLLYDGLHSDFRVVKLRGRDPKCIACGGDVDEELRILDPSAYDYESFTGAEAACIQPFTDSNDTPMRVSVEELQERMDRGDELFIDVRPKEQFDMCALNGFMNVPLSELPSRIAEVKNTAGDRPVLVVCRRGKASLEAAGLLRESGLKFVQDVTGGLQAWRTNIDETFPFY